MSSDLYGAAVKAACAELKTRLAPYRGADKPLADVARAAYKDRVDLSAHGFYATPGLGEKPFSYFTYGAAVAEVVVDVLTGDWTAERADVVMDIGCPINPAIDIGQIEGAFVQGMGWSCLEEVKWGDDAHGWVPRGKIITDGPGNYKLPTATDIPVEFNVEVLEDCPNPAAIHSSRAVGEPPLFLGAAVFFAIRDAVRAANDGEGVHLDAPATPERIRIACRDEIAEALADEEYTPGLSC